VDGPAIRLYHQTHEKTFALIGLLVALSGCSSLVRKDSDWFEAAGHPVEQFVADDQACHAGAADYVTLGVPGSNGTGYGANRAFNAFYSRCMTARHYRSRSYVENWIE